MEETQELGMVWGGEIAVGERMFSASRKSVAL